MLSVQATKEVEEEQQQPGHERGVMRTSSLKKKESFYVPTKTLETYNRNYLLTDLFSSLSPDHIEKAIVEFCEL